MTRETIGMILSLLGMCANVLSFQARRKSTLLLIQVAGTVLFSVAFFFSGAGIGGMMNLLLLGRTFIMLFMKDKRGRAMTVTVALLCVVYVAGLLLYNFVIASEQTTADKLWNVFPVLGGAVGTLAFSVTRLNLLRKIKLGDSACWLAYNCHVGLGALGGILCEVFTVASILLALFRFRRGEGSPQKQENAS